MAITGTLQRFRFGPGLCALLSLALGACAATPGRHAGPSIPASVAVTLPPLATLERQPGMSIGYDGTLHDTLPGELQKDLLDRVRTGFQLGRPEEARIDQEIAWYQRHPDYIERTFNRAAPFLHYIVSEVEARGLPLELSMLPVIESAFEPYAYSRARAAGIWQFIPGTGTQFGLRQDWWYDGRRDIVAATRAALDYLQYLHQELNGDWLLAIAAYNCGEGAVLRQVRINESKGRPTDFWHLKLPRETQSYVPRLLAMARIVQNPGDYELEFSPIPNEPYFQRVETGGQIDMSVAAELAGIEIGDLYELNPAFHRFATAPNGPHHLLLPIEAADTFRQNLLELTPDQRMHVERYAVRRNDTVASIANDFGTTPAMIRELNGLGPDSRVSVDDELRIPSSVNTLPPKVLLAAARVDKPASSRRLRGRHVHVVARGDSLSRIARRTGVPVATLASLNGLGPDDTLRAGQRLKLPADSSDDGSSRSRKSRHGKTHGAAQGRRVTYVVRSGDTLFSIARVLQVSVGNLRAWNSLSSRAAIRPGQRLVAFVRGS